MILYLNYYFVYNILNTEGSPRLGKQNNFCIFFIFIDPIIVRDYVNFTRNYYAKILLQVDNENSYLTFTFFKLCNYLNFIPKLF